MRMIVLFKRCCPYARGIASTYDTKVGYSIDQEWRIFWSLKMLASRRIHDNMRHTRLYIVESLLFRSFEFKTCDPQRLAPQ